jgi:hypothetical protein
VLKEVATSTTLHRQIIIEFQPLLSEVPAAAGQLFFLPLAGLSLLFTAGAGKNVRPGICLLGLAFLFLALAARRNTSVASVALLQLMMVHAPAARPPAFLAAGKRLALPLAGVLVITAATAVSVLTRVQSPWTWDQSLREPGWGVQWMMFPRGATAFLKHIGYQGCIINNLDVGGWLIWEGWPGWKVMADGRLEIKGQESLALWERVYVDPEVFKTVAEKYNVEAVVVTIHIYELRVFADRLRLDPQWALVLVDPEARAEVFLRRGRRWDQVIAQYEIRR